MSFVEQNTSYENWMRTVCDVVEKDLARKHDRMGRNAFLFLRATFFRWTYTVRSAAPEIMDSGFLVDDIRTQLPTKRMANPYMWDKEQSLIWIDMVICVTASELSAMGPARVCPTVSEVGNSKLGWERARFTQTGIPKLLQPNDFCASLT